MLSQIEPFVNEKLDKFIIHKNFALDIQKGLAELYKKPNGELKSKAYNILECGTALEFEHYFNAENTRTLHGANFCKHKLCPMCAWRWHIKQSMILQKAFDILGEQDYYHLVLTIPNIKHMTKEFLVELRKKATKFMLKVAKSSDYFLSFEITIDERGYYHPHYHIIYINRLEKPLTRKKIQTEWAKIANTGTDYAIGMQKKCKGDKIAFELTKYILKFEGIKPTATTLKTIDTATWNIKKISTKGIIRDAKIKAEEELEKERFDKMNELKQYDYELEFYRWLETSYVQEEKRVRKCSTKNSTN